MADPAIEVDRLFRAHLAPQYHHTRATLRAATLGWGIP